MKQFCCIFVIILFFGAVGVNGVNAQQINSEENMKSFILINENKVNDELREILTNAQNQLFSAQEEIAKLQESNYELKKSFSEVQKQAQESKLKQISLEEELASKNNQISELMNKSESDLRQVIAVKNDKMKELSKELACYKSKVDDLSARLVDTYNELENTRKNIVSLQNKDRQEIDENISFWKSKAEDLKKEVELTNIRLKQTKPIMLQKEVIAKMSENSETAEAYYFSLADVYQSKGKSQEAIECYNRLLKISPKVLKAYSQLGIVYTKIGNYEKATNAFNQYIKLSENPQEIEVVRRFIANLPVSVD